MAVDGYVIGYIKMANFTTGMPIYVMFDNINRKLFIGCGMSIGSIDELRFLR